MSRQKQTVVQLALVVLFSWAALAGQVAKSTPRDLENRLNDAQSLMTRGEVDAGIFVFREIIKEHPREARALRPIYLYYKGTGDYAQCLVHLRQLLSVLPNDEAARLDFAQILSWTGRLAEARGEYQKVLKANPKSTDAALGLARVSSWTRNYPESIAMYRKLLAAEPTRMEIRLELGRVLGWAGQLPEAASQLQMVVRNNPSNFEAQVTLAKVLTWQGKVDEALVIFDRVLARRPRDKDALLGKSQALLLKGDREKARQALNTLPARERKSAEAVELERALIAAEKQPVAPPAPTAPAAVPAAPQAETQAAIMGKRLGAAQQLAWAGKLPEATTAYQEILRDEPENLEARTGLARTYSWSRRFPEAIAEFRAILSKDPKFPQARFDLGNALAWAGKFDEAIVEYGKVAADEPSNLQAQIALAKAHAWAGQHAVSLQMYDALLERYPGNLEVALGKGYVLLWQGQLAGARQSLESVRVTNADSTDVQAFGKLLEEAERQRALAVAVPAVVDVQQRIAETIGRLQLQPNNPDLLRQLGELYQGNRQFAEAIRTYELLLKTGSATEADRLALAKYYGWNKQWNPAVEIYRAHLKDRPDDADARIELAKILSWSGQYAESVSNYQTLIKARPDDKELRMSLARVLSWDKKYRDSIAQYAIVLEKHPNDRDAAIEQARVMGWQGNTSAAVKAYDRILQRLPGDRDALLGKGQALTWSGRGPEAAEIIQGLVEKYPQDREIALVWANVQQSLGRPDQALATLSQVETIDPGNRDARQLRDIISQSLRPEIYINFWASLDSDQTNTYTTKVSHFFNVGPRVRSFFSISYMPSSYPTVGSVDAQEFGYGMSFRATPRLALRGDLGLSRLSTGANDAVGSGGISWFPKSTLRVDADVSRRVVNNLPLAIPFDVSRLGAQVNVRYEFRPGLTLEAGGFHNWYKDRFDRRNQQNSVTGSIMRRMLRSEHMTISAGYLYNFQGFTNDQSFGFFSPRRYQRHAAQMAMNGLLTKKLSYSLYGSLGKEMFQQATTEARFLKFHGAGTASIGLSYDFSPGFAIGVTYGYFSVAIQATSGAYHTNSGSAFMRYRF